ncbi:MAG TPA: CDP-alcohol phosphatidyltransferase family protein [Candidatus Dormibacteraeota bacterium]|nr:CDP-alcohol phosphatidyltransferase family protein [Candidatus Dormibacteraeota bacterium]
MGDTVVIRVSASSLGGSACLVVADLAWLALARPPGAELLLGWFVTLGAVGLFLPGVANQVTLARAHLVGPALVYSLAPSRLLQLAAVVSLAGFSDLVDGAVARRLRQPSRLGGALDPVVDGLFFGVVAIGLALGGAYPMWLAWLVVGRYALPAAAGAVLLLAGRRPVLEHTPLGQVSTTVIGVALGGLALLRGLGWPAGTLLLVAEVAIPVAAIGTFANLFWTNRAAVLGR